MDTLFCDNGKVHPFRLDLFQQGFPHIQTPSRNRIADIAEFHFSVEFQSRMQETRGTHQQDSKLISYHFHSISFLSIDLCPFVFYLNPAFSIRLGMPLAETDIACDSRIMPPCPSAKTKDALPL